MAAAKEIPVYLFLGQLESGKTSFIQETMNDPKFDSGDKTLLLICEEGEVEYRPEEFAFGGVTVDTIDSQADLTPDVLEEKAKKSGAGRVLIEYNGMWPLAALSEALPPHWLIYQTICTADGTTFRTYFENMRQLMLEKFGASELLVVNRAEAVSSSITRWVSCSAVSWPLALPLASKAFIIAASILLASKATVRPSRFLMLFMVMPVSSPYKPRSLEYTTGCCHNAYKAQYLVPLNVRTQSL